MGPGQNMWNGRHGAEHGVKHGGDGTSETDENTGSDAKYYFEPRKAHTSLLLQHSVRNRKHEGMVARFLLCLRLGVY